jgi:hypothetical protein
MLMNEPWGKVPCLRGIGFVGTADTVFANDFAAYRAKQAMVV